MSDMSVAFICLSVIVLGYFITHANITIHIKREDVGGFKSLISTPEEEGLPTQEELDEEDSGNNFDQVIKEINSEFGGIEYED